MKGGREEKNNYRDEKNNYRKEAKDQLVCKSSPGYSVVLCLIFWEGLCTVYYMQE